MPRFHQNPARRFGAALFLPALLLAGCAMGGSPPTGSTEASAMQQRVIVRYTPGSGPERDPALVAPRVSQRIGSAGIAGAGDVAPTVTWLRRLAVGADVVAIEPALDTDGMQRLLDALNAEADVDYAEPDGRATIGPGPVMRGPDRDVE